MYTLDGSIQLDAETRRPRRRSTRKRAKRSEALGGLLGGSKAVPNFPAVIGPDVTDLSKFGGKIPMDQVPNLNPKQMGSFSDDQLKGLSKAEKGALVDQAIKNGDGDFLKRLATLNDKDFINSWMKKGSWGNLLKVLGWSGATAAIIVGFAFLLPQAMKAIAQGVGNLLFPCVPPQYRGPACCWTSSLCVCCCSSVLAYALYQQSADA